ncbi:MAG TPA: hypothetical protein VMI73_29840 [Trebonia sp.]|nr:hypothetical protein [Trebonia sp.]
MERTDGLDKSFSPADAAVFTATALTHHHVMPIWGEHEVRELRAELADIQRPRVRRVAEDPSAGVAVPAVPERRRITRS